MQKEEIFIGTKVIYWGIIKADGSKYDPFETEIISEPWNPTPKRAKLSAKAAGDS